MSLPAAIVRLRDSATENTWKTTMQPIMPITIATITSTRLMPRIARVGRNRRVRIAA